MLTEAEIRQAPPEDYMNDEQLEFFRQRLLNMEAEILQHSEEGLNELHSSPDQEIDELDRAIIEEDNRLRLRFLERESKLVPKIREALKRIEDGSYGYCEDTGDPIGIERLLIRPTATLSAEAKEQREKVEKRYRNNRE